MCFVIIDSWPSVNTVWGEMSLYDLPSTSSPVSAAATPQLSVGGPVCSMWGSDVWGPSSLSNPWAPPGLGAPRHPPPGVGAIPSTSAPAIPVNSTVNNTTVSDNDVSKFLLPN